MCAVLRDSEDDLLFAEMAEAAAAAASTAGTNTAGEVRPCVCIVSTFHSPVRVFFSIFCCGGFDFMKTSKAFLLSHVFN